MFKWLIIFVILLINYQLFASSYDTLKVNRLYDSIWYYYDKEDYQKSIYFSEKLINENGISGFKKLKNVYNNLCVLSYYSGNFLEALNYGKQALNVSDDLNFNANIYTNIGNIFADQGDYVASINYYNKALNSIDSINLILRSGILNNIGYAYSRVKKWEEAINYYKTSIELNQTNKNDLIRNYHNCAWAYYYLNDKKSSLFYFKKSIETHEKSFGVDNPETAMSYVNYVDFLTQIGKYEEAIKYSIKANNILNNTVGIKHLYSFICKKNFGLLYLCKGDFLKALNDFQNSLISKIYNFNDTNIFNNPSSNYIPDINIIEVLKYKSLAFEKFTDQTGELKYIEAAFKTSELCVKYIEKLRIGFLTEPSKLTLSANEHDIYISLVRISDKLYRLTGNRNYLNKAFEYSERSKYGVLREVRSDFYARSFAGIPDSITEKERKLKERITFFQLQLEKNPNDEKLNQQLFSLVDIQENLIKRIEKEYPQYYKAKYDNRVVDPDELKKKLRKDQALIEYTIDDGTLYIFTITKDTFILLKRNADTTFYENLKKYTDYLHSEYIQEYDLWRKPSYYLYRQLIEPVGPFIKNKQLIIVPDGIINNISFEPLTTEPYKENPWHMYKQEPYLLYKYPIGYSFSATMYIEEVKKINKKRFVCFAPDYSNSDSLQVMPGIIINAKKIALMFLGGSFTGEKATKNKFVEEVPKYNIIHLFAHGYEDTINPALSRVFMAGDESLYSYEISNRNIDAGLVVLLSCYSGAGNISKGEGVMSIGRSFFNAGSNSAIISLWTTSTYHTLDIIKYFYRNLLRGKNKIESLQLAKIKFIEKANPIGADPQNWSSIVLVGNQDEMFRFYFIKMIVIPAALIILMVVAIIYKRRLFKSS